MECKTIKCPNCGAHLDLVNIENNTIKCSYCDSIVVIGNTSDMSESDNKEEVVEDEVVLYGQVYKLQEEIDKLQKKIKEDVTKRNQSNLPYCYLLIIVSIMAGALSIPLMNSFGIGFITLTVVSVMVFFGSLVSAIVIWTDISEVDKRIDMNKALLKTYQTELSELKYTHNWR